jgi:hypothetical protein
MRPRRLNAAILLAAALMLAACGISGQTRPHTDLGPDAAPLREAFNADVGKVRVVALVSPTCGTCLRGASDMQDHVFGAIGGDRLAGFIVWVPKLDGKEKNVPEATHTVSDPRVTHFWDGRAVLVHGYDTVLGLGTDAWDVYLVYPPGVRWDGTLPPAPAFWMHQLGSRGRPGVDGPYLDPGVFADHIRTLI